MRWLVQRFPRSLHHGVGTIPPNLPAADDAAHCPPAFAFGQCPTDGEPCTLEITAVLVSWPPFIICGPSKRKTICLRLKRHLGWRQIHVCATRRPRRLMAWRSCRSDDSKAFGRNTRRARHPCKAQCRVVSEITGKPLEHACAWVEWSGVMSTTSVGLRKRRSRWRCVSAKSRRTQGQCFTVCPPVALF